MDAAARAVRTTIDNALLAELRKVHPEAVARRIVAQRHDRKLLPDIVLDFDHHGLIRVGDVLADPDKFVGETLADPLEGAAYGRDKAKVLRGATAPSSFIRSPTAGRSTACGTTCPPRFRRLPSAGR